MQNDKQEPIWAEGLRFDKPREGAPAFVKGKLSIKSQTLIDFLKQYTPQSGFVNFDLKVSKKGGLYLQLNPYQNEKAGYKPSLTPEEKAKLDIAKGSMHANDLADDVPFF